MEPTATYYRQPTPELPIYVTYRVINSRRSTHPAPIYIAHYFSILLVYRGEVETSVSGKPVFLQPGDMRIFLQGDLHTFRSCAPDTRYVQISFRPRLFNFPENQYFHQKFVQPLADSTLDCPRILHPGDPAYAPLFAQMDRLDHTREEQEYYPCEIFSVAISLCTALIPFCTTTSATGNSLETTIRTCLKFIANEGYKKITLEQIAEQVHLHPNYLCAVFKNYTGMTIFDYLTRQRLRRATRLLLSTEMPIRQVAESCGFPSASFFSRKFSQFYKITPLAYRKKNTYHYFPEEEEEPQIINR
jgi:AraC-like DNA-binding protein